MSIESELRVNRKNTIAFIKARPTYIVLIPRTAVKTGTGTKLVDVLPPRDAQEVRIIDQSYQRGGTPGTLITGDGKQRKIEFQMLMYFDAQLGLYDYFEEPAGQRWEVSEVLPDNGYERRAQLTRFGG